MSQDYVTAVLINGKLYGEMYVVRKDKEELHCRTSSDYQTFEAAIAPLLKVWPWCRVLEFNSREQNRSILDRSLKKESADTFNF